MMIGDRFVRLYEEEIRMRDEEESHWYLIAKEFKLSEDKKTLKKTKIDCKIDSKIKMNDYETCNWFIMDPYQDLSDSEV